MNLDLARIHFPENLEEPFDLYQKKHFQIKQYYFQRAPIPVVVQKKIQELQDLQEAFSMTYPQVIIEKKAIPNSATQFTQNWSEDFHLLQNIRTKHKTQLVSTLSAEDSAEILSNWYHDELNYAQIWASVFNGESLTNINLAQEADPMLILQLLREISYKPTLQNLKEDRESLNPSLANELKRLSKFVELASK